VGGSLPAGLDLGSPAPATQAVRIYSTNFNSGYVRSRTFI
jgi:hypothetical protein